MGRVEDVMRQSIKQSDSVHFEELGFEGEAGVSKSLDLQGDQSEIKSNKDHYGSEVAEILNDLKSEAESSFTEVFQDSPSQYSELNKAFEITNNSQEKNKREQLEQIFDSKRNKRSNRDLSHHS